ncbi:GIY-YIG nuclease family protein, partial [Salmonella enterica]
TAFNKKIEGTFYVLKIMDSTGNVIAYKIGITNKTAQERCKTINKSTSLQCEVIYSYSSIGSKVQEIESIIKKSITRNYISKELMNDGSTETFSPA